MKRYVLSFVALISLATAMALPTPTTHCYVEGKSPLYLDHYRAEGDGQHKCALFAFGGGFSHGNRANEKYMPYFEMLLSQGFDVVSIDYRLGMAYTNEKSADVGPLEGAWAMYRAVGYAAEDVLRATKYLLDHSAELGIDTSCIVATGSSAGAISVLQAENYISNRSGYAKQLPADFNFAGVVAFAGAIYSVLSEPDWDALPCPIMLFHGNADRNVPYRKATILATGFYGSDYIAEQLHDIGATYYFHSAHYRDHSLAVSPMTDNHSEIINFLSRCVLSNEFMQHTNEFVDETLEPCQTEFTIQEYLNTNYS